MNRALLLELAGSLFARHTRRSSDFAEAACRTQLLIDGCAFLIHASSVARLTNAPLLLASLCRHRLRLELTLFAVRANQQLERTLAHTARRDLSLYRATLSKPSPA